MNTAYIIFYVFVSIVAIVIIATVLQSVLDVASLQELYSALSGI